MNWGELFSRRTLGIRLGLDVVRGVYEALGRPAGDAPAVHIVGTNGKGSVAAMLAHGLLRSGAPGPVGRYTSPHLSRVTERVALDGVAVDEASLWQAVQRVDAAERVAEPQRPLSFFEVLTLAAMVEFARAQAKILVVETGLGGRLDATRIVTPRVVAITSIARDHEAWLGEGLVAIATEKAGVFVRDVPIVSAPQCEEVAAVLRSAAAAVGAPIVFVPPQPRAPDGLPGLHQQQNAGVALAALRHFVPDAAPEVFDGVTWPGRLERFGAITIDVAHNPAGCEAIASTLHGRVDRIFVGCQPDKDRAAIAAALSQLGAPLVWVDLEQPAPWSEVEAAAARGEQVLVCGSHVLVAAIRERLTGAATRAPDPSDPRTAP